MAEVKSPPVTEDTPGFRAGFAHVAAGFRLADDFVQVCSVCKRPGVVTSRKVNGRRQGICAVCRNLIDTPTPRVLKTRKEMLTHRRERMHWYRKGKKAMV